MRALGRIPGELDRRLDRLGARVGEKCFLLGSSGSEAAKFFRQPRHRLIIKIAAAVVEKTARLLLDRRDDFRMRMTGRRHGDTGGEVEKEIAVEVLDRHPPPLFD